MRKLAIAAALAALIGCEKGPPPGRAKPAEPPPAAKEEAEPEEAGTAGTETAVQPKTETAPAGKVVELTEENFRDKTSKGVVLVDFWAPWCPPCRVQGPIVERVAKKFAGRALVCKLNLDEGRTIGGKYDVKAIPTLIIFKDGEELSRMVGLKQEDALSAELEKALGR